MLTSRAIVIRIINSGMEHAPVIPHLNVSFLDGRHEDILRANDPLIPAIEQFPDLDHVVDDLDLAGWSRFQEHLADTDCVDLECFLASRRHPDHGVLCRKEIS